MKKALSFIAVLALGAIIMYGCGASTSSTTTTTLLVPAATGVSYVQVGQTYTNNITQSMTNWAQSGAISGVSLLGVSSPDADGWVHITEVTQESSVLGVTTAEIDAYGKIGNLVNNTRTGQIYGGYSITGSSFGYSFAYGNTRTNPFTAVVTLSGNTATNIALSGVYTQTIVIGGHTTTLSYTYSNYSIALTPGVDDYPANGSSMTATLTYDGTLLYTMTVAFDGTSTATVTINGTTYTFAVTPS